MTNKVSRTNPKEIRFYSSKEHDDFVDSRDIGRSAYMRALLSYAKREDLQFEEVLVKRGGNGK